MRQIYNPWLYPKKPGFLTPLFEFQRECHIGDEIIVKHGGGRVAGWIGNITHKGVLVRNQSHPFFCKWENVVCVTPWHDMLNSADDDEGPMPEDFANGSDGTLRIEEI